MRATLCSLAKRGWGPGMKAWGFGVLLGSIMAAIVGPSEVMGQAATNFGSNSGVTCPGDNVICNGSINFLTTELFFEPETPAQSLKERGLQRWFGRGTGKRAGLPYVLHQQRVVHPPSNLQRCHAAPAAGAPFELQSAIRFRRPNAGP